MLMPVPGAGESYGGIYVPMLANTVFDHNANSEGAAINLQVNT